MFIALCLVAIFVIAFCLPSYSEPFSEAGCPKCGTPTNHHCGMGACVEMCPKCDRL